MTVGLPWPMGASRVKREALPEQGPMVRGQPPAGPFPPLHGYPDRLKERQFPLAFSKRKGTTGGGGGVTVGPHTSPSAPVQKSWGQLQQSESEKDGGLAG